MNDNRPDPASKFTTGGIVNPSPRLIGEDRDCHLDDFRADFSRGLADQIAEGWKTNAVWDLNGLTDAEVERFKQRFLAAQKNGPADIWQPPVINRDQFSRTLADHVAAQQPHTTVWDLDIMRAVPPAPGTDPIGYIDGTTTTPPAPNVEEVLAKVRDLYAKYVPPQPRAYRMHPDTIAELPRAEPNSLTGLGSLFGTAVIPDTRIPRGWIAADDLLWHGGAADGDVSCPTSGGADPAKGGKPETPQGAPEIQTRPWRRIRWDVAAILLLAAGFAASIAWEVTR